MLPAAEKLLVAMLDLEFSTPSTPVIHNTDVKEHTDVQGIREALGKQLYTPIRWVETVESLVKSNVSTIVECGPNKVLTGLNKRIDKTLGLHSLGDESSFNKTLEALS
jgi:[acyl-carrier-protein] S-malonyltransferase